MSIKLRVKYGREAKPITEIGQDDKLVVFQAMDGDTIAASFSFDGAMLSLEQEQRVFLYGLNKLLTDRTSDQKDKLAKLDEMQVVFDLLVEGEWAKERVVGAPIVGAEVEALAEIMKLSIPEAQTALAAYPKEQRAQILTNEEVVRKAKAIRERRAAATPASLDEFVS